MDFFFLSLQAYIKADNAWSCGYILYKRGKFTIILNVKTSIIIIAVHAHYRACKTCT